MCGGHIRAVGHARLLLTFYNLNNAGAVNLNWLLHTEDSLYAVAVDQDRFFNIIFC